MDRMYFRVDLTSGKSWYAEGFDLEGNPAKTLRAMQKQGRKMGVTYVLATREEFEAYRQALVVMAS